MSDGRTGARPPDGGDASDREPAAERRRAPPAGPDGPGPGPAQFPGETRGPKGPEPTRFGDWEKAGRCFDF